MKRILVLLTMFLLLCGCARPPEEPVPEYVLTYAENQPEGYPTELGAQRFAELVRERTDGKVIIQVKSGGEYGSEAEVLEQMAFGGIDFARVSLAELSDEIPKLNVLQLPFLYSDADHMWRILDGQIGTDFLDILSENQLVGLSWYDAGARSFYSTRPIKSPSDLQGMVVRVQDSQLVMDMVKLLGATPVTFPYGDVSYAFQMDMIDAAENNWPAYEITEHYRYARYYTVDQHSRVPEVQLASSRTWDKLPAEYRETIAQPTEGFVAYTMPKPCWAIMRFRIEPAPRGSGVTFVSEVPVRELSLHYQHQVEQALPLALGQGRLGWQVTDVKITLTEGNSHQWHTHPLDFIVATPMGIQDGLRRGGNVLLEPILSIRFLLPADCVGRVMSDVALMRGEVTSTITQGERVILTALVPVESSMDYATTLAAVTGGRGGMSVALHGYRECPLELGATAERRSVDPLDTSKYILAARSALEGGIFDIE